MQEITKRQADFLVYIENFITQKKYSPTVREIAQHFMITPKGAHDHLTALIKKGCITCEPKKSRTIRITAKKQGVPNG